jgi:branched-chain amino acid transport system permease protein
MSRLRWPGAQRTGRVRLLAAVVGFAVAGPLVLMAVDAVPFLGPANLVIIAIHALAGTGLVLILGFSGQISLGHAAFYGMGAYATAILTAETGWSPLAAGAVGVVVAAAAAAVLGRAVFRLRGHFLAMATLAFGLFFFYLLTFASGLTGGNAGRGGIPKLAIGPVSFTGEGDMFLLVWAVLGVGILAARNLVNSAAGRSLRATRASEVAAASSGVHIVRTKVGVFVIGAVYASLAGSLYGHYVTYIAPDAFGLLASVEFLVIATVGGLGSVWGGLVGAVFVTLVGEGMREVVPLFIEGATGSYQTVAYGAALVAVLVAFNKGIADAVGDAFRRWRSPPPATPGGSSTEAPSGEVLAGAGEGGQP